MIHLFHALDMPMALDVGSGAVHALDALAYDTLALFAEKTDHLFTRHKKRIDSCRDV